MNASRVRWIIVATTALGATPSVARAVVHSQMKAVQALVLAQTVDLTVQARNTSSGPIGRIELAPAVDVAPPGPGPEDLPASAPTTPAIACRSDGTGTCRGAATTGTIVILQAVDVSNAAFVQWVGCNWITLSPDGAPPRCNVVMTAAKSVTAWFKPATFTITGKTSPVPSPTFTPLYGGRVQAPTTPAIDCRTGSAVYTACSGRVANGAAIVFTAIPDVGSKLTSWAGCTPVDATTCRIAAVTANVTVTATFGAGNARVTAVVNGLGTVAASTGGSVVDGMSCPGDCEAFVNFGGSITFVATPAQGQRFVAWTGCESATNVCTLVSVSAPASISATFLPASCDSCHGIPPPSPHIQRTDCETCHPGYTATSVSPAVHLNGRVDPSHDSDVCDSPPDPASCVICHPCPP
jgi:Divergent InlB B-repeat domain